MRLPPGSSSSIASSSSTSTGAFHSDFGLGTAERVRRRLGERRVAVVSVLPVKDLDTLTPAGDDLKRADYLLYTFAESKK